MRKTKSFSLLTMLVLLMTIGCMDPTIQEFDTVAPEITLIGESTVYVLIGETYIDDGATASDDISGDLTTSITTVNPVNTSEIGIYTVSYNVVDDTGNNANEVIRTVHVTTGSSPELNIVGSSTINLNVGDIYRDEGALAADLEDGDLSSTIEVNNTVDTSVQGTYTISYNVTDTHGNTAVEVIRTVVVSLGDIPLLTLNGENSISITLGETYTDPGVSATDAEDGDLTSLVEIVNPVDNSQTGTYTITYNVTDSHGNSAIEVTRTVIVTNGNIPVITLTGTSTVELIVGDTFVDEGATASDTEDGDLTNEINIINTVEISIEGTYTVTYNVTDSHGNTATEVTRTVIVNAYVDPNLAADSDFSSGVIGYNAETTDTWQYWTGGEGSIVSVVDGEALIEVTETGGAWWSTQLWQSGISIPSEGSYTLSFDARVETARDITIELNCIDLAVSQRNFNIYLTPEMETYNLELDFYGLADNPTLEVKFGFGNNTPYSLPTNFYLDNVKVVEGSDLTLSQLDLNITDGVSALEGVSVEITSIGSFTSDISGDYSTELNTGIYQVTTSKDGYVPNVQYVIVNGNTSIDITLEVLIDSEPAYLFMTDTNTAPAGTIPLTYGSIVTWSGSILDTNYTGDVTYNPCLQATFVSGWGNSMAFNGIETGALATYETMKFKVKADTHTFIQVKMVGAQTEELRFYFADGTTLSNSWYQMSIDLSLFGDISTVSEIGIFRNQGNGDGPDPVADETYLLTDIIFE